MTSYDTMDILEMLTDSLGPCCVPEGVRTRGRTPSIVRERKLPKGLFTLIEKRTGAEPGLQDGFLFRGAKEKDGSLVATFFVPGVDPKTIDVEASAECLRVAFYNDDGVETEERIPMPERARYESATAECSLGVLTVTVPLDDRTVKSVKVPVTTG